MSVMDFVLCKVIRIHVWIVNWGKFEVECGYCKLKAKNNAFEVN